MFIDLFCWKDAHEDLDRRKVINNQLRKLGNATFDFSLMIK